MISGQPSIFVNTIFSPLLVTAAEPESLGTHPQVSFGNRESDRMDRVFGSAVHFLSHNDVEQRETEIVTQVQKEGVVGLFFSALWSAQCRGFTPKLVEVYTKVVAEGHPFQVVFVSNDTDEEQFGENFAEQPWLAIPFKETQTRARLLRKFVNKATGMPRLVLFDAVTGKVLNKNGMEAVEDDKDGQNFPWRQLSLAEIMGNVLVRGEGGNPVEEVEREEALRGKFVALYFSATWCGPCEIFTPKLRRLYESVARRQKEGGAVSFEVVFVSKDRDEAEFKEYLRKMPWLAVPFSNASARSQITSRFRIKALPSLVLLDATGRLLSTDLISKINVDPDAEHFPWTPKLVAEAQDCEQRISECAATVVLCEGMGSSEQERVRKLLEEAATAEQERAREEGEEDGVFFCVCAESGEFSENLRRQCGLGEVEQDGKLKMVLLDVPQEGAYYVFAGDSVDAESVARFVRLFDEGQLTRQQLE